MDELYALVTALHKNHDCVGIVIISGSQYGTGQQLLDEDRFWFLQGDYGKIASAVTSGNTFSGLELLLDSCHHGKSSAMGFWSQPQRSSKNLD